MAKANLTLPNGTKVSINGSSEEIAKLMHLYSPSPTSHPSSESSAEKKTSKKASHITPQKTSRRVGPLSLIKVLKEENFFKAKRAITEIQKKLEETGHIYAQTSISPALLTLVKKRILGRVREGGTWKYVHR